MGPKSTTRPGSIFDAKGGSKFNAIQHETTDRLLRPEMLKKIPLTIIHGEGDVICSVENSWLIKKAAPHAKLVTLPNCGHDLMTPQMIAALLEEIKIISELPHAI